MAQHSLILQYGQMKVNMNVFSSNPFK